VKPRKEEGEESDGGEMGGAYSTHEETRNANKISIWRTEGRKRPVEKPSGVDWIHLAQDRDQQIAFVNTVTNLRVPYEIPVAQGGLCCIQLLSYLF